MKCLLTLMFALSMSISVCLPVQAQYSFQEDSSLESTETGDAAADSAASGRESSTAEDRDVDVTEKEGDASAAAYGVDHLENAPDIMAESAVLMDAASGAVLYGKEEEVKQYPASITKVMTALLAIENCSMSEIVTYSSEAVNGIEAGSSSAGINVGAELTVEDSLYALMLVSANEAGAALAEHISGSNEAFADLMNQRAEELGCTGTHFTNPHGLPDENHYTTAKDMALIMQQAMQYEAFSTIAGADTYTLEKSDTLTNTLELWNHSKIIRENSDYYYEYAEGSKPGYTMAALNTLVTYAKKDNVELICVILRDYGADNSYYDTTALFEWGFEQVKGITPLASFDLNAALRAASDISEDKLANMQRLNGTVPQEYYILVKNDFDASSLQTTFVLDEDIHNGRIGYVNITVGDTLIGRAEATYDVTSEAAQSYIGSGSADDNLETAPVDEEKMTPGKMVKYGICVLILLLIVLIIMKLFQRRQAEKRRQQRIRERRKKYASSQRQTSSQNTSSRTTSSRNRNASSGNRQSGKKR